MQSELKKIRSALAGLQEQMQATMAWQSKALNMPFLAERRLLLQESSTEVGQLHLVGSSIPALCTAAAGWRTALHHVPALPTQDGHSQHFHLHSQHFLAAGSNKAVPNISKACLYWREVSAAGLCTAVLHLSGYHLQVACLAALPAHPVQQPATLWQAAADLLLAVKCCWGAEHLSYSLR